MKNLILFVVFAIVAVSLPARGNVLNLTETLPDLYANSLTASLTGNQLKLTNQQNALYTIQTDGVGSPDFYVFGTYDITVLLNPDYTPQSGSITLVGDLRDQSFNLLTSGNLLQGTIDEFGYANNPYVLDLGMTFDVTQSAMTPYVDFGDKIGVLAYVTTSQNYQFGQTLAGSSSLVDAFPVPKTVPTPSAVGGGLFLILAAFGRKIVSRLI